MKKLIAFAFLAFGLLPAAFAQYGTWRYNPNTGAWVPPGVAIAAPQYVQPQPYYGGGYAQQPQYVPQMASGIPGINNCSVIGGVVGGVAGNRIDHHGAGGTVAGALLGGAIGNLICSNNQGQRVIVQQPQGQNQQSPQVIMIREVTAPALQAPVAQPLVQQPPPVQQSVSGVFCNIDGLVTKEADNAACEAKAKKKAEELPTNAGKVDIKSQASVPVCARGKTWTKLNWPGHHQHDGYVCLPDDDPHRY